MSSDRPSHDTPIVPPVDPLPEATVSLNSADSKTPPTIDDRLPPLREVGGYEILSELGRGGMGVVYRARQKSLNRLVALKMLLAAEHAGREQLVRFQLEAETLARLQHPNIVQIHEVGEQDGRAYFALELVAGGSLAQKLAGKPQPIPEAARLVEILARAVDSAHQRGIIHRDLKPGNVLVGDDGAPKITDFGLSKDLDHSSGLTRTGGVMGTPSYMAPEQAAGKGDEIGPRTDVYALGAILYEMLTGRPPFRADTHWNTVTQVIHQDVVPPRRLRSDLPRDLETICLKCLEKKPARRYGSALELAEDLRRFQAFEPIQARPPRLIENALRKVKRRLQFAWGFVGALLLLGLVLFFWQPWRVPVQPVPLEKVELDGLQGIWHPVHVEKNGLRLPDAVVRQGKLVITGNSYLWNMGKENQEARLVLCAKSDPKCMDVRVEVAKGEEIYPGIFQHDQGGLMICLAEPGQDRPISFDAPPGSGRSLFTYRRERTEPAAVTLPGIDLVPREAVFVASLDLTGLWQSSQTPALLKEVDRFIEPEGRQFIAEMEKKLGMPLPKLLTQIERVTIAAWASKTTDFEPLTIVSTSQPQDLAALTQKLLPERKEVRVDAKTYFSLDGMALHALGDRNFLCCSDETMAKLLREKPARESPMAKLAQDLAAQGHQAVVCFQLPKDWVQFVPIFAASLQDEEARALPRDFLQSGGAIGLGASIGSTTRLQVRWSCADEEQARKLAKHARPIHAWLRGLLSAHEGRVGGMTALLTGRSLQLYRLVNKLMAALEAPALNRWENMVDAVVEVETAVTWQRIPAEVIEDRPPDASWVSLRNLIELHQAMRDYHRDHGHFPPPAIYSKDGQPLLSWRVALLPYLRHNLQGELALKLDEPWDSPHNQKILDTAGAMPAVFAPVGDDERLRAISAASTLGLVGLSPGQGFIGCFVDSTHLERFATLRYGERLTFYQVLVGPGAAFEANKGMVLDKDFVDGAARTLLIVEGSEAVPWTKPVDVPYAPKEPLPALGGLFGGDFHACFADGSYRRFPRTLDPGILRALITRNGGEKVALDPAP